MEAKLHKVRKELREILSMLAGPAPQPQPARGHPPPRSKTRPLSCSDKLSALR